MPARVDGLHGRDQIEARERRVTGRDEPFSGGK